MTIKSTGQRTKQRSPEWQATLDYLVLAFVAVLMALNYQIFILQNAFAPSGLNGLATMIQYLFHFSVGYFSLILNIPLAVYCWFFVNKRFAARTMVFVMIFSGALLIMQRYIDMSRFIYHTEDGPRCWRRWFQAASMGSFTEPLSGGAAPRGGRTLWASLCTKDTRGFP